MGSDIKLVESYLQSANRSNECLMAELNQKNKEISLLQARITELIEMQTQDSAWLADGDD